MRRQKTIILVVAFVITFLMANGCTVHTTHNHLFALKQDVMGSYYLKNNKYQEGILAFKNEEGDNPENAETQYYLGRFQLAKDNPGIALIHLQKAANLSNDEAEYHFWLGVAYGVTNDFKKERESYLCALDPDKGHLQAMTYLGHNHFKQKEEKK